MIKVYDKARGEKLIGQKVEYFHEGDRSNKSVQVKIEERPEIFKCKNPKYITLVGFNRYPAESISNDTMYKIFQNFGI